VSWWPRFRTPIPRLDKTAERHSAIEHLRTIRQDGAYPDYTITVIKESITRRTAVVKRFPGAQTGEKTRERLFKPLHGEDLGVAFTSGEQAVLVEPLRLHDDLLYGTLGPVLESASPSAFVTLPVPHRRRPSGGPGSSRWRRSLSVR
jgi:hypothetical protein